MVTLSHLSQADLVRILTEPKNALVKQYQGLFSMENSKLEFSRDGLGAIADLAIERETGVRALRSILEGILLDLLYELPNREDAGTFVVDADVVRGERRLALGLDGREDERESEGPGEGAEPHLDAEAGPSEKRESA